MFSETRYALNGDLRVAYRASREGPRDLVFVPTWFTNCEVVPELPSIQGWIEAMTSLGRLIFFDQPGTGAPDPRLAASEIIEHRGDAVGPLLQRRQRARRYQPPRPQIHQTDPTDQTRRRLGQQDLPTMSSGHHSCGSIEHRSEVVPVSQLSLAGCQSHAHRQLQLPLRVPTSHIGGESSGSISAG